MLRDEVKKQKAAGERLELKVGGCRFCGQTRSVEIPKEWSDSFVDEYVTELCDCSEASAYTWKKERKEKAEKTIDEQFGKKSKDEVEEEVQQFMRDAVENIIENRIGSVSIGITAKVKAKIAITSKGLIKVEKVKTEKTSSEA